MSSYNTLIKISEEKLKQITKNPKSYDNEFWKTLESCYKLPETFIEKNLKYLNITSVSSWQKLSEDFMCKYINKLDPVVLSEHQELSFDFMRKYGDILDWDYVSWYQDLNRDFIMEFYDKLDLKSVRIRNQIEDFMDDDEFESLVIMKKLTGLE